MDLELSARLNQEAFAATFNLSYPQYRKLVTSLTASEVIICLELLKAKRHRSEFRASMERQVRSWLADTSGTLKPLSPKQFLAASPKWPINYTLP